MSEYEKIELTNMCMIYDNNGNVVVQDKINKSWGGITFPAVILKNENLLLILSSEKLKKKRGLSSKTLNYAALNGGK